MSNQQQPPIVAHPLILSTPTLAGYNDLKNRYLSNYDGMPDYYRSVDLAYLKLCRIPAGWNESDGLMYEINTIHDRLSLPVKPTASVNAQRMSPSVHDHVARDTPLFHQQATPPSLIGYNIVKTRFLSNYAGLGDNDRYHDLEYIKLCQVESGWNVGLINEIYYIHARLMAMIHPTALVHPAVSIAPYLTAIIASSLPPPSTSSSASPSSVSSPSKPSMSPSQTYLANGMLLVNQLSPLPPAATSSSSSSLASSPSRLPSSPSPKHDIIVIDSLLSAHTTSPSVPASSSSSSSSSSVSVSPPSSAVSAACDLFASSPIGATLPFLHPSSCVRTSSSGRPLRLRLLRTLWGFTGNLAEFFRSNHATGGGYTGYEAALPFITDAQKSQLEEVRKEMVIEWSAMIFTDLSGLRLTVAEHLDEFKVQLALALEFQPQPFQVNSHSGMDSWTSAQSNEFFTKAAEHCKSISVPVYHETHRGRAMYNPWITRDLVQSVPALLLTADYSHWVTVCERLIGSTESSILTLCASRVRMIHARVGFEQGPQVNDPRAPEWSKHVLEHESYWSEIMDAASDAGLDSITIVPEWGPGDAYNHYQPKLPFSNQPVANIDDSKIMNERERSHRR